MRETAIYCLDNKFLPYFVAVASFFPGISSHYFGRPHWAAPTNDDGVVTEDGLCIIFDDIFLMRPERTLCYILG